MKKTIFSVLLLSLCCASVTKAEETDLTGLDNVIYVESTTVNPDVDGTDVTLSICMNNTAAIRGFQFDMYLPEGAVALKSSKGKFLVSLDKARLEEDDEHTLTVAEQADGAIRFLCGSQYDENFTGTSGQVATMKISIEGMAAGQYPITLKGMKLTETDISKYYETAEVVTTLTITGNTVGITSAEALQRGGAVYNLQGQKLAAPKKGINIQNGNKVVMK